MKMKVSKPIILNYGNMAFTALYGTEILPGKPNGTISGSMVFNINDTGRKKIKTDFQITDMSWSDLKYKKITLNGNFSSETTDVFDIDIIAMLDSSEIKIKGNKELKGMRNIDAQFKLIPVNSVQPFVQKLFN